jgi:hypothetical protein
MLGSFVHGSMANALPQAIGAQLPDRGRQVIAMCGDGGFAMLMGDFLTLLQYDLPVKVVIFDNGSPRCRRRSPASRSRVRAGNEQAGAVRRRRRGGEHGPEQPAQPASTVTGDQVPGSWRQPGTASGHSRRPAVALTSGNRRPAERVTRQAKPS